ncbi:F-box only protein 7-like [Coccinella septempunctata]|uniref:F-box only protein 7-like n=1 Tax=Coccinella septempunctata TaxID=41139 RepID=UPI001D090CB7|nr:F-box only protein 7-like [Coccinella septempunctata]XP_044753333.1 F-box only protein 7-like [Coccinella septempunctata]XP_044753334.1 F-box only protein 7-like [Coccinella septempunctata]
MEPLLLEDFHRSNIPTNLIKLMKVFEEQGIKPSKSDFLVGCIYVLMLEYGFIPQEKENAYNESEFCYKRIEELIPVHGWKKCDEINYNLSFILVPYQLYVCKISCIKMGDDLVINAFVRNIEDAHCTVMLDILTYYTDGVNMEADVKRMQNLRAMSALFKDQIAYPIKHAILRTVGHRHACLEDLPLEIIYYIFKYIHGTDIVRLTTTCKRFYVLRQEAKLWEYLLKRDFNICMKKDDYKELFEKYGLAQRRKVQNDQEDVWTSRYSYRVTENTLF